MRNLSQLRSHLSPEIFRNRIENQTAEKKLHSSMNLKKGGVLFTERQINMGLKGTHTFCPQ